MKIKPQHLTLIAVLFVWAVLGILFFGTNNMGYLFSRSIDQVDTAQGEDPRPAVESLDAFTPEQTAAVDREKLLQDLEQELVKTENDPDKAMELRRRIQLLKNESSPIPTTTLESNS